MTTLAVQVGVDTLRAGRSIRVNERFATAVVKAIGQEVARLVSEPSVKVGWVVLRLAGGD